MNDIIVKLRNYLLTGLLVSLPVVLTFYIVIWIFDLFDSIMLSPFVGEKGLPVKGLGVILFVILMICLGFVAQNFMGKWLIHKAHNLINKIPIIKTIYSTLKQVLDTVLSQNPNAFKGVALIEYPRKGLWALVFVTSEIKGEIADATSEETVSVFLPTTPNPTSGFLLFVPKKDLKMLKMKPDDAMKLIISGGIVSKKED
jgi:uncharacterized membrane protein